ncbi:MAG: hypothetical protein ACERKN_18580 [Velocimicrobium sp.]
MENSNEDMKQDNLEEQETSEDKKCNSEENYMSLGMCMGMCLGMSIKKK